MKSMVLVKKTIVEADSGDCCLFYTLPAVRWLTIILMCVAMIFFAGSFVTPNPGAIGAPGDARVRGILKITRHPSFVSFILFGFAHMLMNGWVGDLFFFGSFALLGVVGGIHQDNRKLHELGEPYHAVWAAGSLSNGSRKVGSVVFTTTV